MRIVSGWSCTQVPWRREIVQFILSAALQPRSSPRPARRILLRRGLDDAISMRFTEEPAVPSGTRGKNSVMFPRLSNAAFAERPSSGAERLFRSI